MSTSLRYKSKLVNPVEEKQDHDKQYVGFATLPNQVHRKSVKKGFDFTLMVAGESGLGKSTLVNSLFLTDLYKDRKLLNAEERINQTVEILKHTVDIEEKGVKLKLTIVDTPGFGDAVNNTQCWKPITDYVDQQFEQYFRDESGLNRKNIQDNRVHCCLYFISPFGHGWVSMAGGRVWGASRRGSLGRRGSRGTLGARGGRQQGWEIGEID
ncbi:septin-5-like isoform X2 [Petaurus breviceps papuanus]|uniref:septin-5-like isoform X2 n=1 Tax=Petaurus breviceps papuanus TaxID=3040969 RepID=UPI0036DBDF98